MSEIEVASPREASLSLGARASRPHRMRLTLPPRLFSLALTALSAFTALAAPAEPADYATPRFTDPERATRLRAVLPEIDRIYRDFAAERHLPGLVWGIVLDGQLVHTGAHGLAHLEKKIPAAAADTRFRIASMSKSFTALAILKLRDAGKLALHDPVEKHVPDFRHVARLTSDAPVVTVRHLLVHSGGFPQDDPWADPLLGQTTDEFAALLRGGLSSSTPAGTVFEYSNLGYALLGQIVARAASEPYQRYITREIFEPLGMKHTSWDYPDVPADKLALGYRWEDDTWKPEVLARDGVFGAMGGVITTIPDLARYAAFHLAAWPARNDPDTALVRRATLREMHKPGEISFVNPANKTHSGEINPQAVGYAYGLRWSLDSKHVINVGHSGGLPGYGSHWYFFPAHGFAVLSFANRTYAGTAAANAQVAALLLEKAALPARTIPPSPILAQRKRQVADLIQSWDPALAADVVSANFFPDRSRESWQKYSRETFAKLGRIRAIGEIVPENQLRGTFPIEGENGRIDVSFTLTPEKTPRVQHLRLTFVPRS